MTLTKQQLNSYFIDGLLYSCVQSSTADFDRSLGFYRQILANGYYHLPFFIIHDISMVLYQGQEIRFRTETNFVSSLSTDETQLIRRYERECLARLLQSPDIRAAIEISSTSQDRVSSTERLLIQLLNQFGQHYPAEISLNPSLLRNYQIPTERTPSHSSINFTESLTTFLNNLNDQINWAQILVEEDLFELAHLQKLHSDHLRIGCRQILQVNRQLRNREPLVVDITNHEDGVDTAFVDETHYPTGGLSSLTNRGNYENLLTSELVYIDEGKHDISLFDLRFAEGELLFYTRDSGNLRRKRRSIHFILDVNLIFEHKLPGYQWQYSVLLQGFCLRLLNDLFEIFEKDALRFHFHYIESPDATLAQRESFKAEIGIMQTVLCDYEKHDWVRFNTARQLDITKLVDDNRKSYAIILTDHLHLQTWQSRITNLNDEGSALHTALIAVDSPVKTGTIEIPRSGKSNKQLNLTKQAVLEQLIS